MTGMAFVSGGSGYVAGFIVRDLLAAGWSVQTTLRSLSGEAGLRALLAAQEVDASALRCFAADLLAAAGWADALAGGQHFWARYASTVRPMHAKC